MPKSSIFASSLKLASTANHAAKCHVSLKKWRNILKKCENAFKKHKKGTAAYGEAIYGDRGHGEASSPVQPVESRNLSFFSLSHHLTGPLHTYMYDVPEHAQSWAMERVAAWCYPLESGHHVFVRVTLKIPRIVRQKVVDNMAHHMHLRSHVVSQTFCLKSVVCKTIQRNPETKVGPGELTMRVGIQHPFKAQLQRVHHSQRPNQCGTHPWIDVALPKLYANMFGKTQTWKHMFPTQDLLVKPVFLDWEKIQIIDR